MSSLDEKDVIFLSSSDSSDSDSDDCEVVEARNSVPSILQKIKLEGDKSSDTHSPSSSCQEIKYTPLFRLKKEHSSPDPAYGNASCATQRMQLKCKMSSEPTSSSEQKINEVMRTNESDRFSPNSSGSHENETDAVRNPIPCLPQQMKLEQQVVDILDVSRSASSSPEVMYIPPQVLKKESLSSIALQSNDASATANHASAANDASATANDASATADHAYAADDASATANHASGSSDASKLFSALTESTSAQKLYEKRPDWAGKSSPPIFKFGAKRKKVIESPLRKENFTTISEMCKSVASKGREGPGPATAHKSSTAATASTDFEVEKILDHEELSPERILYKVKWKNFDETHCTWEPLENLINCIPIVYMYKKKVMSRNPVDQRYQQLFKFLSQHTETLLNVFLQRFINDQGVLHIPRVDMQEIKSNIRHFARHPALIKTNQAELDYLRELLLTSILWEKRRAQLEDLQNYEIEINVMAGNAVAPIYVINNVDLEVVTKNLTHTCVNIPTEGVTVNEEPVIWCECTDNCAGSESCCGQMNDSVAAYDVNKRLIISHGTPIYECNKNCKCNYSCPNRVIQLGTQVKLAIYKTYNNCGWGIQTLEDIPKGTFVTEYVGEILTYKAAAIRVNQTYLFNLDFNGSTAYVIDACNYGNISHFINHSCDPNLAVFPAYIQCLDPNLHRLPLFAIRDIKKGEQLSFSYYKSANRSNSKTGSKKIKCKCDSKVCCGYLLVE